MGEPRAMNESKTHHEEQLNSLLTAGCISYVHSLLLSLRSNLGLGIAQPLGLTWTESEWSVFPKSDKQSFS